MRRQSLRRGYEMKLGDRNADKIRGKLMNTKKNQVTKHFATLNVSDTHEDDARGNQLANKQF